MGKEIDDYLRQWRGVCPAILQYGMRINLNRLVGHNYILARQRALGLRKLARHVKVAESDGQQHPRI